MYDCIPDNPYYLLTPGPLSTSKGVRNALLRDWCTWDEDYNKGVVQEIRKELVCMAASNPEEYTAVLMQGSGTFGVEACLGTAIDSSGAKLLIISNGAYGMRMAAIMKVMKRDYVLLSYEETEQPCLQDIEVQLKNDPTITHVAMVHCETTTGILNPIEEISKLVKQYGKTIIIDAMSSFAGIPIDMSELNVDFLISSANKCIQGVPGFSFIIAKKSALQACEGHAHSFSLDLYDQWKTMDLSGKWRFTSPTHVLRAFQQALAELKEEGGVKARYARYSDNQHILSEGMKKLGYHPLLEDQFQSPIITSFLYPGKNFAFNTFYETMKQKGFVLYPGKISKADTFRIGTIGDIYPETMKQLLNAIKEAG